MVNVDFERIISTLS